MFTFALTHAYLIPLFPAIAFLIIGAFTRREKKLSAAIAVCMMSLAFVFSVVVALAVMNNQITMSDPYVMKTLWAKVGGVEIVMGVLIDPLTAMMLVIVTLVSLLVYIYSVSYMDHEAGMGRFFVLGGDAWACRFGQFPPALCVLGGGRALLLFADRLLL